MAAELEHHEKLQLNRISVGPLWFWYKLDVQIPYLVSDLGADTLILEYGVVSDAVV